MEARFQISGVMLLDIQDIFFWTIEQELNRYIDLKYVFNILICRFLKSVVFPLAIGEVVHATKSSTIY